MLTILQNERGAPGAATALLKQMLIQKIVDAVFVAAKTPWSALPMPCLFRDPDKLEAADLFAPVAPFNAARQASSILRQDVHKKIAFVMRPCEIRALFELVKLKQAVLEPAVLIGLECRGRMEKRVFLEALNENPDLPMEFMGSETLQDYICDACKACDLFLPVGADLTLALFGYDGSKALGIFSGNETGEKILQRLSCPSVNPPAGRDEQITALTQKKTEFKKALVEKTSKLIGDMDSFQKLISTCLNCYNCRTACPVCYCKECVFNTDVFIHPPELLIQRALKKGAVKLPSDTTMFHLTRLAHMAHACVACGHCTSVCPSDIPVADVFMTAGSKIQELFDYVPGRSVEEPIPYLVFKAEG
jgi:formate dehydrogenase (coenzyme F420) beta subunit